jgi:hypothetical protein
MPDSGKQLDNLEKAIARAIVFFDMFAYPLTVQEIFWYLGRPAALAEVAGALKNLPDFIGEKNGFYFLAGQGENLNERPRRFNFTMRKIKIARWIAKIFRFVPFIEVIALSNVIGSHNLREGSDIDFFIITQPRRIWLTRFLCAGLAKILNLRPNKKTKRDKICLSFYITTEKLNLADLKISAADWYFNYWLAGLVPLYDRSGIYDKLMAANSWIKDYLPNWEPPLLARSREIRPVYKKKEPVFQRPASENLGEIAACGHFLDYLEKAAKNFQLKILPAALKELMNKDTRVIINDQILKLYLTDRRAEFMEKYEARLRALDIL